MLQRPDRRNLKKRVSVRVQVHNRYILPHNLYQKYYYPNPKYSIIGYMDPLGLESRVGLHDFRIQ